MSSETDIYGNSPGEVPRRRKRRHKDLAGERESTITGKGLPQKPTIFLSAYAEQEKLRADSLRDLQENRQAFQERREKARQHRMRWWWRLVAIAAVILAVCFLVVWNIQRNLSITLAEASPKPNMQAGRVARQTDNGMRLPTLDKGVARDFTPRKRPPPSLQIGQSWPGHKRQATQMETISLNQGKAVPMFDE